MYPTYFVCRKELGLLRRFQLNLERPTFAITQSASATVAVESDHLKSEMFFDKLLAAAAVLAASADH